MTPKKGNSVSRWLAALLLALLLPSAALAQFPIKYKEKKMLNLSKYDRKLIHFGFILGTNYTDFAVRHIPNMRALDSVYVVEPQGSMGFNLGIVSDLRLGEHFNLRFIPGISFVGRSMEYSLIERDTIAMSYSKEVESVFLEVPLYFKFRSRRINNWRVYLMGGGKFLYDMATKEEVNDELILKLKKEDYTWDLGVGIDLYLHYFKLSIEARMAFGMNNLLVRDNTVFTQSIESIRSKTFLLSFYFE